MQSPAVRYVTTSDGFRIAYACAGQGPPLVWMNSIPIGPSCHLAWTIPSLSAALALIANRRTVVLFDSRGCGMSERRTGWLTLDGLLLDLQAVVDRLDLETFDLSGWALGGTHLAVACAVQHAARVRRLVLLDPLVRQADLADFPQTRGLRETLGRDWQLFTETIAVLAQGLKDDAAGHYSEVVRATVDQRTARHYFAFYDALDVSNLLPSISAPTLVVHFEGERFLALDSSAAVAAAIPDARLVTLPGTPVLNPEAWANSILSFLEADLPSPGNGLAEHRLSLREIEVLRQVADGKTNQQIADELVISLNTVRRHMSNIFGKTGAANRADAVSYGHRHSLF